MFTRCRNSRDFKVLIEVSISTNQTGPVTHYLLQIKDSIIKIAGCIHDDFIIEAPVKETSTAAQILHDSMVDAGKMYLRDVLILH